MIGPRIVIRFEANCLECGDRVVTLIGEDSKTAPTFDCAGVHRHITGSSGKIFSLRLVRASEEDR